jgi:peptide/nickel transport system ATP-binding protein
MYAGKVVEKAPTSVLFSEMRMPYTEALLNSIPKLEDQSHTRLRIIGGRPPDLINPPKGCNFSPRCPYVQPKCLEEEPPLVAAQTPGHEYACWFPVGTPEGRKALADNLADEVPAAVLAAGADNLTVPGQPVGA